MPKPTTALRLTADRWAEIWAGVNTDYPLYRGTEAALAKQGQEWYQELRGCSLGAVNHAWSEYRKTGDKRPKLANLLALAAGYERWQLQARERYAHAQAASTPADPDRCPCGCGGVRWARVLTAPDGAPRQWSDGKFVTRDELECLAARTAVRPAGSQYAHGADNRRVLVLSTPRETFANV